MRNFLMIGIALLLASPAQANNRDEALRLAQTLTNKTDGLTIQTSNDALDAFVQLNTALSRDLRDISKDARDLATDFHLKVLDKLYTNATARQIVREIDRITPACQRLGQAINQADVSPAVANLFADVVYFAEELRARLDGPALWVGSCRVVREFIWGDNIEDYVATATANTQALARSNARQFALSDCQAELQNLQECNVIDGDCYATQQ